MDAGRESGIEALRASVTVARPPAEAFEVFTAGIARWWPLRSHSIGEARAAFCAIEPRVGGEVYEVRDDGQRFSWGRVLVWEPPHRLVMSWHPGRPLAVAQEVEVRFTPEGGGTRVDLEHRGWEKLGEEAADARASYEGGWRTVLGTHFAGAFDRRGA
ncbi:MAG TPA: SRPBCC family protein [Vicinamibacteria bacterium]|jgi:uncharacterized protein YndB with AHSA1/START domain